jgi:protein involved in polysaccharide export with SLBB domain
MKNVVFSMLNCFFILIISFRASSEGAQSQVLTATANSMQTLGDSTHPLPFKAGDALEIIPYPDTAFPAGHYPIDGEGYVDFPIIGYVKVTTMSPDMLAKLLAERYVDYMRYPLMTIRPVIRVTFNGGFYKPGDYWIDPHASLWQAIQIAGGTLRSDGYKKLQWERSNVILKKNLSLILEEGKSLYQIGFQTGDQITIIQQPLRTKWEVISSDIIPLLITSISIIISAFALYNTSQ